jgi:hypothetical protein
MMPFFVVGGVVLVAILLALPPAWEYSNSVAFCGTTCHTMPPEYNSICVTPRACCASTVTSGAT